MGLLRVERLARERARERSSARGSESDVDGDENEGIARGSVSDACICSTTPY